MISPTRNELADLWNTMAQIDRNQIFGAGDALRPHYEREGAISSQINVPALGTVGTDYRHDSIALVSVNPAGGKLSSQSAAIDDVLYRAFARVRDAEGELQRLEAFEHMNKCFAASMPTWRIWGQFIDSILRATSRRLDEVAYLYLVPFRTQGDTGSTMPDPYLRNAYALHLKTQLDLVLPRLIIAVDRPSEQYCNEWVETTRARTEVIYFTRKRDAHARRAEVLLQLQRRCATQR